MKERTVYLCGPINGCTDQECNDWRSYAKSKFEYTLDPMRRDYRGREQECVEEIVNGDIEDLKNSGFVLANCPKPSVGTSMEILLSHQMGITVVAVVPEKLKASPWLVYHCDEVFESMSEAIDFIKFKMDQGRSDDLDYLKERHPNVEIKNIPTDWVFVIDELLSSFKYNNAVSCVEQQSGKLLVTFKNRSQDQGRLKKYQDKIAYYERKIRAIDLDLNID